MCIHCEDAGENKKVFREHLSNGSLGRSQGGKRASIPESGDKVVNLRTVCELDRSFPGKFFDLPAVPWKPIPTTLSHKVALSLWSSAITGTHQHRNLFYCTKISYRRECELWHLALNPKTLCLRRFRLLSGSEHKDSLSPSTLCFGEALFAAKDGYGGCPGTLRELPSAALAGLAGALSDAHRPWPCAEAALEAALAAETWMLSISLVWGSTRLSNF